MELAQSLATCTRCNICSCTTVVWFASHKSTTEFPLAAHQVDPSALERIRVCRISSVRDLLKALLLLEGSLNAIVLEDVDLLVAEEASPLQATLQIGKCFCVLRLRIFFSHISMLSSVSLAIDTAAHLSSAKVLVTSRGSSFFPGRVLRLQHVRDSTWCLQGNEDGRGGGEYRLVEQERGPPVLEWEEE